MTRPKPVNPPAGPPSTWGNVTLAFQDADGKEVAAFTIDPEQEVHGKRARVPGEQNPGAQTVPDTAVSFTLDWQLVGG